MPSEPALEGLEALAAEVYGQGRDRAGAWERGLQGVAGAGCERGCLEVRQRVRVRLRQLRSARTEAGARLGWREGCQRGQGAAALRSGAFGDGGSDEGREGRDAGRGRGARGDAGGGADQAAAARERRKRQGLCGLVACLGNCAEKAAIEGQDWVIGLEDVGVEVVGGIFELVTEGDADTYECTEKVSSLPCMMHVET